MKLPNVAAALLLALAVLTPGTGRPEALLEPAAVDPPTAEEWRRLRAGDVLVAGRSAPGPEGEVVVRALFRGDASEPWRLLGDCRANYRFVPGLEDCELLRDTPTSALTRFVHKAAWYLPRVEFTFETARQPREWIRMRLTGGDLEAMEGSWRFEPVPAEEAGGPPLLLVTHRMRVRPGIMAPRWLVRRTLERDSANLLHCLRGLAEATPELGSSWQDRSSCQPAPEASELQSGT